MTTVHPLRAEAIGPAEAGGASERSASGSVKTRANLLVAVLAYVTNHVVTHLPNYRLRHAWYRRVLGLSLGRNSGIFMGCFLWFNGPRQVRRDMSSIGARTRINHGCCLDVRGPLRIGHDVSVSPQVMILTAQHGYDRPGFAFETRPVVIEDHVWIGSRAVILPGSTIERGAVVAAGAVVSGRVAPMTVVGGVPARPIGRRPEGSLSYEFTDPCPFLE